MTLQIDFPPEKEKEVLNALKALGVSIAVDKTLTGTERRVFKAIKKGFKEIELAQEGKIKLQTLDELIDEL